jgi:hypothetical protein
MSAKSGAMIGDEKGELEFLKSKKVNRHEVVYQSDAKHQRISASAQARTGDLMCVRHAD